MSFRLVLFGTLPIPEEIQRGDSQTLGTGNALTSFLQLPGGGWYDNYRERKSPQGIRPISKSGLFWGTNDELDDLLMDWRALIGVRAKLTAEMDNGRLMWQWARLQNVDTPRPSNAKGGWLPFTFTWITAAQNWRGVVFGAEDWTWGDGTWVWNDGTAEFDVGAYTFTLADSDETITLTHGGTIDAPNVTLRFAIVGAWQDCTIVNETTGQQIVVDRATTDNAPLIEINAGARSVYTGRYAVAVTTMMRSLNTLQITTSSAHGLTTGDSVRISGTDAYDGDYYPVTTEDTDDFYVPLDPEFEGYGTETTGTIQGLVDAYNVTTFTDKSRWLVLKPGANTLRITWSPFPTSVSLTVEFVSHYG
jgi:hypothetical protein